MVSRFRPRDNVAIERAAGGHVFIDTESIKRATGYQLQRPRLIIVIGPLLVALAVLAWGRR